MINIQQLKNNLTEVELFGLTVWVSYKTIVGFRAAGRQVISQNYWSNTTGRHLTEIDGGSAAAKKARVSQDEFLDLWNELVEPKFAAVKLGQMTTDLGDLKALRLKASKRRSITLKSRKGCTAS